MASLPSWRELGRRLPREVLSAAWARAKWLPIAGLLVLFGSLWAFGVLVEDVVTGDPIVRLDRRLAGWLHEHATGPRTEFFEGVTALGNAVTLLVVSAGAAALLLARGRRADALLVGLSLAGAEALTFGLKLGFRRERPFFADPLAQESTFSFPSGHAMVSMAVYGALAFVLARGSTAWVTRAAVLAGATALVLLIGFSRLYLGVHYLSDVLAGLTAGLAWLVVCILAIALHEARPLSRGREGQTSR